MGKQFLEDLRSNMERYFKICRYLISGGTAAAVNIGILFLLTHYGHVWYLLSSVISFLISFGVSFSLQKFWTFKDHNKENIHKQGSVYLLVTLTNLGINILLMYMLVQYIGLHYIIAQIITGGLIAIASYFVYGKLIFNRE